MTFRSALELVKNPDLMRPPEVLVQPCVVAGYSHLLVLLPKKGKSTTAGGLAAEATRQGVRTAVLTLDESMGTTLQRLVKFGADLSLLYLRDKFDPVVDGPTFAHDVVSIGIELLVVDHLMKIAERHPDFGPNSHGDNLIWGRVMAPLTAVARDHGVGVVLLDQARKSDGGYSGPAAKAGSVDLLIELEPKDGGLRGAPAGRAWLPAFRIDLDAEKRPVFSLEDDTTEREADAADLGDKAALLLRLLSDAEPEGLTSTAWRKLAEIPTTTYHRARKRLIAEGLILDPSHTRTPRYRITDKGEASLGDVPQVPRYYRGTSGSSTTGAKPLIAVGPVPPEDGTTSRPGTSTTDAAVLPRHHHGTVDEAHLERLGIEEEAAA